MATRVFVDANVLFSRCLRDWLFLLRNGSGGRMYTVGSSEDVIAETVARYRDAYPQLSGAHVAHLRTHLVEQLDEMVQEYEIREWMLATDEGDGHVRAAATDGQFRKLLTSDAGLLLDDQLRPPVPYEPIHPDEFFVLIDDSAPELVARVTQMQVRYFMERDGQADLPAQLNAARCPLFAERIRVHLERHM